MTAKHFKNEIKKVLNHYISLFGNNVYLFIVLSIYVIIINYLSGAYILFYINLLGALPTIIKTIYSFIRYKKLDVSLSFIYSLILTIYVTFFIAGVIYFKQFPLLSFWFLLFLYLVNTVNSQIKALFFHSLVYLTIYLIFFSTNFDFSYLAEKNINANLLVVGHVIGIIIAVIFVEIINTSLFFRLIGDMIDKNRELEGLYNEQTNIQKVKDNFFTTISHEMRTPLNAIKGISDLVIDENLDKYEIIEYKKILQYSSNHLLSLVNDVLDFTKINLGEFNLSNKSFNLEESIKLNFDINCKNVNKKDIKMIIEKKSDIPTNVIADFQRFNQMLMNLLSNAIKYTDKGYVKFSYWGQTELNNPSLFNLYLKIEDSGIGIKEEYINKIFDKYFQAKTSQHATGIGLGLFITKKIIDLMNGSVNVKSNRAGTTFEVCLPLLIDFKKHKELIVNNKNKNKTLSNLKILIVEDNNINQIVLSKLLFNSIENCKVTITNNGLEALEKLKYNQFDIILMDLIMPQMDGYECTKEIRNSDDQDIKNIPIIAITANVWENDLNSCLEIGINDFVTKPFDINDLLDKINNQL